MESSPGRSARAQVRDWQDNSSFLVMQYRAWRSHTNGKLFVLCGEGAFEDRPREVRQLGPWAGAREGEVVRLQPQYRALLAEQGFVLIYSSAVVFEPEVIGR